MRPSLLRVVCLLLFAASAASAGRAQTAELYQGKPSLVDADHQFRVTLDERSQALRIDGLAGAKGAPHTPIWGCQGKGALTILPTGAVFRTPNGRPFAMAKRDYSIEVETGDNRLLTLYGDAHACWFRLPKAKSWLENLLVQAWLESRSGARQFRLMTGSLVSGAKPPTAIGEEWGACESRSYTGEEISANISLKQSIRNYFHLLTEIEPTLRVEADPTIKSDFTLVVDQMPWDLTLPIMAARYGFECKFENKTLSLRKR